MRHIYLNWDTFMHPFVLRQTSFLAMGRISSTTLVTLTPHFLLLFGWTMLGAIETVWYVIGQVGIYMNIVTETEIF